MVVTREMVEAAMPHMEASRRAQGLPVEPSESMLRRVARHFVVDSVEADEEPK
jgi:hypothetical protein